MKGCVQEGERQVTNTVNMPPEKRGSEEESAGRCRCIWPNSSLDQVSCRAGVEEARDAFPWKQGDECVSGASRRDDATHVIASRVACGQER